MPVRGNKPVGWTARMLLALSASLILLVIIVSVIAGRQRQAFPERGAAALPGQAARAGARPGTRPVEPPAPP